METVLFSKFPAAPAQEYTDLEKYFSQSVNNTESTKIGNLKKMKIEAAQREKDKELELEKLKLQAAQREKDKGIEMEKLKIEAEVELKKIEAETTSHPLGAQREKFKP